MSNYEVGAVIIGRNEGERLIRCIQSLTTQVDKIVYVDSGSTDGSFQKAEELGVYTVILDMGQPFTAARARNAGADFLLKNNRDIKWLQFVDGDCELQENWISAAFNFLKNHDEYAVVCGRRRERFPDASIYNQLCDIEWNTPIGDAAACGGDALYRASAFSSVNGFNPSVIAGEEPELCFRLRQNGWKVYRIEEEMTLHDAAMTTFSQWWKRTVRAGYAFSLGASMHGDSKEKYWVKERSRIYVWGIILPVIICFSAIFNKYALFLVLIYPVQIIRIAKGKKDIPKKWQWAAFLVLGKFAESVGLLKFRLNSLLNKQAKIIEYK
jgi:GT2 family glycosyltransferase